MRREVPQADRLRSRSAAVLRVALGAAGIAAITFGVLWAAGVLQVLTDPNFNPNRPLAGYETRSLVTLGSLGVLASLVAGVSGLAYAKTTARAWLTGVTIGIAVGVPVFFAWIDLYDLAGGVN